MVPAGAAAVMAWGFMTTQFTPSQTFQAHVETEVPQPALPLAQIRERENDTVRVRYVRPQLLQNVEFETTGR